MKKPKFHYEVEVIGRGRRSGLSKTQIVSMAQRILKELMVYPLLRGHAKKLLRHKNGLTLVFVDRTEGRRLNRTFRNKNYPTDVLSFNPIEEGSLGELVFCVPVLKSQSHEHGLPFREELRYLLIHGILHLLGYDHEANDRRAKDMYRLQDQLFGSLYGNRNGTIRRKK